MAKTTLSKSYSEKELADFQSKYQGYNNKIKQKTKNATFDYIKNQVDWLSNRLDFSGWDLSNGSMRAKAERYLADPDTQLRQANLSKALQRASVYGIDTSRFQNLANFSLPTSGTAMNAAQLSSGLANGGKGKANRRLGESAVIKNGKIVGASSGKVYEDVSSLSSSEQNAKLNQLVSGSTPSVSGRPDLYATKALASEGQSYVDPTTGVTVNPRAITASERTAQANGTLQNYNSALGATYLDGPTFSSLQPYLSEGDLLRGVGGRIYLKPGLSLSDVKARAASSGGASGAAAMKPAASFSVDVPKNVPSDLLSGNTVTDSDINSMMGQLSGYQNAILEAMNPTQAETDLQQQLVDVKAAAEKVLTELSMGLNNIEDQPIAMQFITGQQASVERNANAKLQNLSRVESNLLANLGLVQEARNAQVEILKTKASYIQSNIETQMKVQQIMDARNAQLFNQAMALKQDAKSSLTSILESLQGLDESDLANVPGALDALKEMADKSGIPYSLILGGLEATKNEMMFKASESDGFTLSPGETRYDAFGNIIASSASTVDAKTTQAAESAQKNAEQASSLITDLLTSDGLNAAVGAKGLSNYLPGTAAQSFKAKVDQLKSLLTLSILPQIKGTGALSDKDIGILEKASSALNYDLSEEDFKAELRNVQTSLQGISPPSSSGFIELNQSYSSLESLLQSTPEATAAVNDLKARGWNDTEILQAIEQNGGLGLNNVGTDTQQGANLNKVLSYKPGQSGGQCGRFVNTIAGTKMGDSYSSKMSYVNVPPTAPPQPGDVFVMPYQNTGHTGFVLAAKPLSDGSYDVLVKDSNWSLDEKVKVHTINSRKLSGYARVA